MEEYTCNIAVLGQTGVGKSSLLNYLLGTKREETGTGKPVTGMGFYRHEGEAHGTQVVIYDTWGIEADKTYEWKKLLEEELRKHGIEEEIKDWFHAAVFCIGAGSHRVQDFEIEMIRQLLAEKVKVVVVLTKADLISKDDSSKLQSAIKNECGTVPIVEVCSTSEERRDGTMTKKFGEEKLLEVVLVNWRETICARLPDRLVHLVRKEIQKLRQDHFENIIEASRWFYSDSRQQNNASPFAGVQTFQNIILNEIEKTRQASVELLGALDIGQREIRLDFSKSLGEAWRYIFDVADFFAVVRPTFLPVERPTLLEILTLGVTARKLAQRNWEAKEQAWQEWLEDVKNRDREEIEKLVKKIFEGKIMEEYTCNIAVLGKTGVGKSSLLNYLLGTKREETGTGKPVTGMGFYRHEGEAHGKQVVIYDTWGIEANKTGKWEKLLEKELGKHGIQQEIKDWFHAAVFCIGAGSHRVEDFEIEMIRQLLGGKVKVVVVLTKADLISKADSSKLQSAIENECGTVPIVEVCSTSEERRGTTTKKFGEEKLLEAVLVNWRETICARLPDRLVYLVTKEIEKLRQDHSGNIIEASRWFYSDSRKQNNGSPFARFQTFQKIILNEIEKTRQASVELLGTLGIAQREIRLNFYETLGEAWGSISDAEDFFAVVNRTLRSIFTFGATERKLEQRNWEAKGQAWQKWLDDVEKKDRGEIEKLVNKIFRGKFLKEKSKISSAVDHGQKAGD